jgi:acyl-coenzyme A thioesterase PaaI-like protein
MSSTQHDVTREVLRAVHDFLGGPTAEGDEWCFEFGQHLTSNWGAIHGGALAAATLTVARVVAPDRSPRSIHIQIVRPVPSGRAVATTTIRHPGRTVATIEVDLYDERRKLAATALFTMVTPEAVAADYDRTVVPTPFRVIEAPVVESNRPRGAISAEIVAALKINEHARARNVARYVENFRVSVDGTAAAFQDCMVPWTELVHTGPEAACLIADASVGFPVSLSSIPSEYIGPNPDLTLRFTTAPAARVLTAASAVLSVQRGTATIGIEVRAGDNQLAHGLATSLLLRRSS